MILRTITTLLVLIPFFCFGQGVSFEDLSFSEALQKAESEGKQVFIDGYATWCGPCKRMDATTFTDSLVGATYNDAYVSIKLDMEKGEGLTVAHKYNVKAYPTYIFLDDQANVLHKAAGYFDTDDFLAISEVSKDTINRLGALQNQFELGSRDTILLDNLLEQQFRLLDPNYLTVALERAKLVSDWNTDEMRAFILKYGNTAVSPLFEYMVKNKSAFYEQFGEGVVFGKIEELVRTRSFEIEETSIAEMVELFDLVYPEQAKEMGSKYRLSFYRQKGDRQNYGIAAIDHYKQFPSRDAQELNEVGATFSRVIDDQILLKKVIPLVEMSIKLEDAYYNNDTLAALQYKLGNIASAKIAAVKAIRLAKTAGEDSSLTEDLLEVIDEAISK